MRMEHPSLILPIVFVSAREDGEMWLPTRLQMKGKFEDFTCREAAGGLNE